MKRMLSCIIFVLLSCNAHAQDGFKPDDGNSVNRYGTIPSNKYENTDITAPWNDPLKRDDFFAPWNDPLLKDDYTAPWNDPFSDPRDTNDYLHDQGVKDSDYYWK